MVYDLYLDVYSSLMGASSLPTPIVVVCYYIIIVHCHRIPYWEFCGQKGKNISHFFTRAQSINKQHYNDTCAFAMKVSHTAISMSANGTL